MKFIHDNDLIRVIRSIRIICLKIIFSLNKPESMPPFTFDFGL